MIFASNLKRFPKRSHWPLFLKANQARLYIAFAMALCRRRLRPNPLLFCQVQRQKEALKISNHLLNIAIQKIAGGVMNEIRQNQGIRNMRCKNGNARNSSSVSAA